MLPLVGIPRTIAKFGLATANGQETTRSRILRQEFPELLKLPSLWTRSYFVSTAGNVSRETIKKYIANHSKK